VEHKHQEHKHHRPAHQSRPPQSQPRIRRRQSIEQRRFEQMVERAVDHLPPQFHDLLSGVAVVVEDEPTRRIALPLASPTTRHSSACTREHPSPIALALGMALPERIVIYRLPLEEEGLSRQEAIWEIQRTLVHELGHHFGISEKRIAELGWE